MYPPSSSGKQSAHSRGDPSTGKDGVYESSGPSREPDETGSASEARDNLCRCGKSRMVQVFVTHDRRGGIKKVCRHFESVFGWKAREVESRRMPYLHPDVRSKALDVLLDHLEKGPRLFTAPAVTKFGRNMDVQLSGSRWSDCCGSDADFVVGIRPIAVGNAFGNAAISTVLSEEMDALDREVEALKHDLERTKHKNKELADSVGILLNLVQEASSDIKNRLIENYRSTVLPVITKLQSSRLPEPERVLVDVLEINLRSVVCGHTGTWRPEFSGLTPRQVQICELIRKGKDSKEIADVLGVSFQTVIVHQKTYESAWASRARSVVSATSLERTCEIAIVPS